MQTTRFYDEWLKIYQLYNLLWTILFKDSTNSTAQNCHLVPTVLNYLVFSLVPCALWKWQGNRTNHAGIWRELPRRNNR